MKNEMIFASFQKSATIQINTFRHSNLILLPLLF